MALPAELLRSLPSSVSVGVGLVPGSSAGERELGPEELNAIRRPLGLSVDEALPDGGLPKGAVVELAVSGSALGTTLGLAAISSAQLEGQQRGGAMPWCAWVDPSSSLHAPGVAQAGVELERLLVVRPAQEALSRVALKLIEAQAFPVVVVDLVGPPGADLDLTLSAWARVVRRLAVAVQGTEATVILLTDAGARRSLPLPVALRVELSRPREAQLSVRVAKDKRGRVRGPRRVSWQSEACWSSPGPVQVMAGPAGPSRTNPASPTRRRVDRQGHEPARQLALQVG